MYFNKYFYLKFPYSLESKNIDSNTTTILTLKKCNNRNILANITINSNNENIVIVDPGDIILYINATYKKKLIQKIGYYDCLNHFFFCYFFKELFSFSNIVIKKFSKYNITLYSNRFNNNLGVHIRLGKDGDFHEKHATYFVNNNSLFLFNSTILKIIKENKIDWIILSSDSSKITNINNKKVIVVRKIVKIKQLKHSNNWYFNDINDNFIECLLEVYMLSKSKYMILTSNSAFSKVAFYMNRNCNKNNCIFL